MSVWSGHGVVAKTTSAANPERVLTTESPGLEKLAMAVGAAWAHEMVRALREDERAVIGAWPGTLSEAKMRVLVHLNTVDVEVLADLARVAIEAARGEWRNAAGRNRRRESD